MEKRHPWMGLKNASSLGRFWSGWNLLLSITFMTFHCRLPHIQVIIKATSRMSREIIVAFFLSVAVLPSLPSMVLCNPPWGGKVCHWLNSSSFDCGTLCSRTNGMFVTGQRSRPFDKYISTPLIIMQFSFRAFWN